MRIVGGTHRGLGLASVGKGDEAARLRPTSDRVRESVFNLLLNGGYGDRVTGARVLDLFAGTGAMGLEALSRGAAHATFVENGRRAQALIRRNVAKGDWDDRADLLPLDALRLGACSGPPCDLVLLDPPYGRGLGDRALEAARSGGWIAPDALAVWEESAGQDAPPGFRVLDIRRYGGSFITILRDAG